MTSLLRMRWGLAFWRLVPLVALVFPPQTPTLSAVFLSPLQFYQRYLAPLALGRWQVAKACCTEVKVLPLLPG